MTNINKFNLVCNNNVVEVIPAILNHLSKEWDLPVADDLQLKIDEIVVPKGKQSRTCKIKTTFFAKAGNLLQVPDVSGFVKTPIQEYFTYVLENIRSDTKRPILMHFTADPFAANVFIIKVTIEHHPALNIQSNRTDFYTTVTRFADFLLHVKQG